MLSCGSWQGVANNSEAAGHLENGKACFSLWSQRKQCGYGQMGGASIEFLLTGIHILGKVGTESYL